MEVLDRVLGIALDEWAVGAPITWPEPDPPVWAIAAGLPPPCVDEDFLSYVTRLGLSSDDLTRDLDQRTAVIANVRLEAALIRSSPQSFQRYVDARRAPWLPL